MRDNISVYEDKAIVNKQPLAEVFGYQINDFSKDAIRSRKHRLCPFNNKVPSCTKDKAERPLGVCSIHDGDSVAVTCPIRFRQDWLITTDAAAFFFPDDTHWTALTEIRLSDGNGKSAGNIDVVLVAYDDSGTVVDFGAIEVQAVYISGNVRNPFEHYMEDPKKQAQMDWRAQPLYPRADYLSSSRKRLAPQLLYKGGILHSWGKRMAVVIDKGFYNELPELPSVPGDQADIAWLIYDMQLDSETQRYKLNLEQTIYTEFNPALERLTVAKPGDIEVFRRQLQRKLEEQRVAVKLASEAPALYEVLNTVDPADSEEGDE
ncbi:MAG: hypothetical protein M1434_02150 [Chloroflexi bacterium]|nr:hypothetical protein [Chloroflexota bacterium]MCL5273531.1 hypothetical protein [Chloroflexota bacterium]